MRRCKHDGCEAQTAFGSRWYCPIHRSAQTVDARKQARKSARLKDRVIAGLCGYTFKCPNPCAEGRFCLAHATKHAAYCAAHRSRTGQRGEQLAAKRRRDMRKAAGLCRHCNQPCVTAVYCETHRLEAVAYARARRGPYKRKCACSICGKSGHRRDICTARRDIQLASYATARNPVDLG